jgi:hypothetical protein
MDFLSNNKQLLINFDSTYSYNINTLCIFIISFGQNNYLRKVFFPSVTVVINNKRINHKINVKNKKRERMRVKILYKILY